MAWEALDKNIPEGIWLFTHRCRTITKKHYNKNTLHVNNCFFVSSVMIRSFSARTNSLGFHSISWWMLDWSGFCLHQFIIFNCHLVHCFSEAIFSGTLLVHSFFLFDRLIFLFGLTSCRFTSRCWLSQLTVVSVTDRMFTVNTPMSSRYFKLLNHDFLKDTLLIWSLMT